MDGWSHPVISSQCITKNDSCPRFVYQRWTKSRCICMLVGHSWEKKLEGHASLCKINWSSAYASLLEFSLKSGFLASARYWKASKGHVCAVRCEHDVSRRNGAQSDRLSTSDNTCLKVAYQHKDNYEKKKPTGKYTYTPPASLYFPNMSTSLID